MSDRKLKKRPGATPPPPPTDALTEQQVRERRLVIVNDGNQNRAITINHQSLQVTAVNAASQTVAASIMAAESEPSNETSSGGLSDWSDGYN